jgi:hypothetical protein
MTLPTRVELDVEDAQALVNLNIKADSIRKFVASMTEEGEKRIAALQHETADFWQEAAEKYNLDIMHVNYTLSPDGKAAVPMAMRFEA